MITSTTSSRVLSIVAVLAVQLLMQRTLLAAEPIEVEGQPLAANVKRVLQALDYLGHALPKEVRQPLEAAAEARDARQIQELLDPHVLLLVTLNPEARVKVSRGPARAILQQAGYTPVLVKIVNDSTVTKTLNISSPQSGPVYAGVAELSMQRQDQPKLRVNENVKKDKDRFLNLEMFTGQPLTANLSGLKVEYALALLYSGESGQREATIAFDVGSGSQDLGFRGEVPILFEVRPAIPVKVSVRDVDGRPTTGRFVFRDRADHVYPPQPKRLAPDLFFQQQIYRRDGGTVLLPPGELTMQFSRGPEYRLLERKVVVPSQGPAGITVQLERWINPAMFGFYSGDHHIHAAGCAHYTSPSEGVLARDMFLQVQGEGLNVGCVLTWGPCYEFQHQFFSPRTDPLSEPLTLLKYDVEVSGFGSQALGHVCLLNLREQQYPGSDGVRNWPTWTVPVLRWAKKQGAHTGYAHSASGLAINSAAAAQRFLVELDRDKDGQLSLEEASKGLLPEPFAAIDADRDGTVTHAELTASMERAANRLPNLVIPEMNGVGAQEIFITTALGLCDFISAMDTARVAEWNCWYHILNCGFPLKVSGETDFPCMSSTRVGQGRVYVQLGKVDRIDFPAWCAGLASGRSYVSDGYAHALEFRVQGKTSGEQLALEQPATIQVQAKVAFAPETPVGVPYGTSMPKGGTRLIGDTVNLHEPRRSEQTFERGGKRLVELVVNGVAVASREVPADGQIHDVSFPVKITRSSWVALRQFPQLHTNPVSVIVADKPIRASRQSARWCIGSIEQLWRTRGQRIAASEREEAQKAYRHAIDTYRQIAAEAPEGS